MRFIIDSWRLMSQRDQRLRFFICFPGALVRYYYARVCHEP